MTNAWLVQHLDGGRYRVTGTPMQARRGVLQEAHEHEYGGVDGLYLADGQGAVVAWISAAAWRMTPHDTRPERQPRMAQFAPRGLATPKRPEHVGDGA